MKKYAFWSSIFGNIMDQYDVAIYAFLAPFVAPLFFKQSDPVVAIILTYGLMSLGIITRPLGAFIFGRMAINHGPKRTLITILIGMTCSTLLIGLMPTYDAAGVLAPILLALVRSLQSLFAAGEVSVASMFILDDEKDDNLGKASSYYSCSTMIGICLASFAATFISKSDNPEIYWRYAFFASLLTALPALAMRILIKDLKVREKHNNSISVILESKGLMLRVIFTSSFSYMTYAVPFIFMNSFVPHILPITKTEMLQHNDMLILFDIFLIIFFSIIVDKFPAHKWMACIAGLFACTIIPLFYFMQSFSLAEVTLLRVWIIILGVAYSNTLNSWFFKLIKGEKKYLVTGVGYAIGTELLGRNTTVICWSLFYYFESLLAPAYYLVALSLLTCLSLLIPVKSED